MRAMTEQKQPGELSAEDIATLAAKLDALQAELRAQDRASEDARATVPLDQQSVGRLSRMDALQQQAMAEAEARRRTSDLARIDAALKRIETGDFGWCGACGEPIGQRRLDADPMATRCIKCAE